MIILIDNGHGLDTRGKHSPDKTYYEWAWTREIARLLQRELAARGLDARLLVPEARDIPLPERVRRVNAICAQYGASNVLLISLHSNAAGSGAAWMAGRGWEAWTSPGATKADTAATCLYEAAKKHLSGHRIAIRTDYTDGDPDKEAAYYILTKTRCPAVLTENLFHDNREDLAFMTSPAGRQAIVALHADGIEAYVHLN